MARSPRLISGWSAPHEPILMNVGRCVIARISATAISTLSVPMPVETTDTRWPRYVPVADANSRCSMLELDGIEARGDPGGPRRVAGEEDVLGQLARRRDPMWYCRSPSGIAIRRSRGFRRGSPRSARPLLTHVPASLARNSAEDSHAFSHASSVRMHESAARWPCVTRARATHEPTSGPRRPVGRGAGDVRRTADRRQTGGDADREQASCMASPERRRDQ